MSLPSLIMREQVVLVACRAAPRSSRRALISKSCPFGPGRGVDRSVRRLRRSHQMYCTPSPEKISLGFSPAWSMLEDLALLAAGADEQPPLRSISKREDADVLAELATVVTLSSLILSSTPCGPGAGVDRAVRRFDHA